MSSNFGYVADMYVIVPVNIAAVPRLVVLIAVIELTLPDLSDQNRSTYEVADGIVPVTPIGCVANV